MARRKPTSAAKQYWIGYCRKSTDTEDKQIHSLQDQSTMITEYYERLPTPDKERYPLRMLQEAQSAYHPGREIFNAILSMALQGQVHGVIAVHPNRISRNHMDSGAFVQMLVDRQITSLDTTSGKRYTGADSNDIFMLTLEGAMSWKDSRDKGDRILQAMRLRATEGKHMGPAAIGYRNAYQPDGAKALEVVPETARIVRRLFELAATGIYSVQDIVREARKMDLKCRSGKTPKKGAMHRILHDPLYKGYVRFDGIIAKGRHEPIVDEAIWERVQEVFAARCTNTPKPQNPSLRDLFFFGSLLTCPRCSRTLCPYRVKGRYFYYECKNPETRCRVLVPQPVLMKEFKLRLKGVKLESDAVEGVRRRLVAEHHKRSKQELGQRSALNAEYEQVVQDIADLFSQRKEAQALGIVQEVDARIGELRRRRNELQGQLNACHEEGND